MRILTWLTRRITADRVAWTVAILSGIWCFGVLTAAAFFPAPGREPWLHEWFTMLLSPERDFGPESVSAYFRGHLFIVLALSAASAQAIYLSCCRASLQANRAGITRFAMLHSLALLFLGIEFAATNLRFFPTHADPNTVFLQWCCELFHPTKWHLLWLVVNYLLLGRHMVAGIRAGRWQVALGLAGTFQGFGVLVSVNYLFYRASIWATTSGW